MIPKYGKTREQRLAEAARRNKEAGAKQHRGKRNLKREIKGRSGAS